MRARRVLVPLLGLALAAPRARAAEPPDPRGDIERLEQALAEAVERVSQPSAFPMPAANNCRGYRIQGLGAVFVLTPRALGSEGGVFVFHAGEAPTATGARATPRPPHGRARVIDSREQQMRIIEAQVEAFQREAERSREQAERALEQLERQVRVRLAPPAPGPERVALAERPVPEQASDAATTEPPVDPQSPRPPQPPAAAQAPAPAPPPAPWRYWFQSQGPEEERPAAQIVADVRSALTEALESEGATLTVLRPDELLVTAVDFVSAPSFAAANRPDRTLVIRVRKKDLEERRAGKIGGEELRKRIDYAEY